LFISGRVDWYVKVVLDDEDIEKCDTKGKRDVYRYPEDLELTPDLQWEISERI
jgi:hypothetical protein